MDPEIREGIRAEVLMGTPKQESRFLHLDAKASEYWDEVAREIAFPPLSLRTKPSYDPMDDKRGSQGR